MQQFKNCTLAAKSLFYVFNNDKILIKMKHISKNLLSLTLVLIVFDNFQNKTKVLSLKVLKASFCRSFYQHLSFFFAFEAKISYFSSALNKYIYTENEHASKNKTRDYVFNRITLFMLANLQSYKKR